MEVNPVPELISDEEIELKLVCKAILTGYEVKPDDLQACHRSKKRRLLPCNLGFASRSFMS